MVFRMAHMKTLKAGAPELKNLNILRTANKWGIGRRVVRRVRDNPEDFVIDEKGNVYKPMGFSLKD